MPLRGSAGFGKIRGKVGAVADAFHHVFQAGLREWRVPATARRFSFLFRTFLHAGQPCPAETGVSTIRKTGGLLLARALRAQA